MKFKENLVEIMKQEKVAVICDTEEKAKALLNELDKCGVCWVIGEITHYYTNRETYKGDTYYIIYNGCLECSPKLFYINDGYRIIEFEELLKKEATSI